MRAKDEAGLSVLRMLSGAIKNREISLREGAAKDLGDEEVIEVVKSEIKKRNDAIASYETGGRKDLADKEAGEVKILEKYMPPQLSDEEIDREVKGIIEAMGPIAPSDFGKAMGQVMAKLKGKADGNKISAAVKKALAK